MTTRAIKFDCFVCHNDCPSSYYEYSPHKCKLHYNVPRKVKKSKSILKFKGLTPISESDLDETDHHATFIPEGMTGYGIEFKSKDKMQDVTKALARLHDIQFQDYDNLSAYYVWKEDDFASFKAKVKNIINVLDVNVHSVSMFDFM
jgi:hypothetical protein